MYSCILLKLYIILTTIIFEKPYYILFNIMFKAAGGIEFYF